MCEGEKHFLPVGPTREVGNRDDDVSAEMLIMWLMSRIDHDPGPASSPPGRSPCVSKATHLDLDNLPLRI